MTDAYAREVAACSAAEEERADRRVRAAVPSSHLLAWAAGGADDSAPVGQVVHVLETVVRILDPLYRHRRTPLGLDVAYQAVSWAVGVIEDPRSEAPR